MFDGNDGLENLASPEFVHVPDVRFRVSRRDAEEVVKFIEELAIEKKVRESVRMIRRGATCGAFVTRRFAEHCWQAPDLLRAQVTWSPGAETAYLVLRGFVDHASVARRVMELCFHADGVHVHNIAGVELAMTVARPPRAELDRLRRTSLPIGGRSGPVNDLLVWRRRLTLPSRHVIPVTVRGYEREGDPARGVLKLEISTREFGDIEAAGGFLPPSHTASMRDILFAGHELLHRIRREHGLQPVPMPLNYKGLPIRWERRKLSNLIRDPGPAGMLLDRRTDGPHPHDRRVGEGVGQMSAGVVRAAATPLVTEAGVPIFLDDRDDEVLLKRLAEYLPFQQARYERCCKARGW